MESESRAQGNSSGCPRLSRLTDIRAQRHQAEPTSTRATDNIFIRSGYAPPGAHESLIWRDVCQGGRHEFLAFAVRGAGVMVGWVGGGPAGLCATRGQTDIRGFVCRRTMVRRGEPLSSIGRGRPWVGRVAQAVVADSPRVAGPPPTQPTGWRTFGLWLLDLGDRPAEAGEFAGGGDGDDRAALGALLESCPGAMQTLLR